MRVRPYTPALAFVLHAACTGVCKGPGCEEAYPTSHLSVVRGVLPGETELSEAELGEWRGTESEGTGWTAVFAGSGVLLGQPDDSRVVVLADRQDRGTVQPLITWSDPATELGAALVVVPAPDDPEAYDLWIGAPGTSRDRGAVHLLRDAHLAPGSDSFSGDLTIRSATPSDRFGSQLVGCADLDGDRVPDLAIPAPQLAEPDGWAAGMPPLAGAVFFVLSSQPPELDTGEIWTSGRVYWGETAGEGVGTAVSCDRDLDEDGRIDIVIGAPWHDGTRGRIYFLDGIDAPSGPLVEAAERIVDGPTPREWYGTSLVTLELGDQALLAVGSPGYADGSGRVHVYPGRELDTLGPPRPTAIIVQDPQHEYADHFGRTLAQGRVLGGESDGLPVPDGVPDLIIGAPDHRDGSNGYDTGRIWVLSGADRDWDAAMTTADATAVLRGSHPFERVGRALAVGDPDRDGVDDLLVPTRAPAPE